LTGLGTPNLVIRFGRCVIPVSTIDVVFPLTSWYYLSINCPWVLPSYCYEDSIYHL